MRKARRKEEWQGSQQWLLTPSRFVRGEPLRVAGAQAFRQFIGLESRVG